MSELVERRRLGRRMSEPYFKLVARSHGRELLILAVMLGLLMLGGWYFQV